MEGMKLGRLGPLMAVGGILLGALPAYAQTAVWTGAGPDTNFTTGANWAGGAPPPNNGTDTLELSISSYSYVGINTGANILGLQFLGTSGFTQYDLFQVGSGSLTIGSGGISTPGGINSYLYLGAPVILSANQTWNGSTGYLDVSGNISQSGGAKTLTVIGAVYLFGDNTFSGGLDVTSGPFYAGSDTSAGTGTLTLADGTTLESYYNTVTLSNPVSLGNNVTLGSIQSLDSLAPLTLSGTVTVANASTTMLLNSGASVYLAGTLAGPPSTSLMIQGNNSGEPIDGGSQIVLQGTLSNVASINVSAAQLILAPSGNPATSFSSLSASGLQVSNSGYLGLDGTFVTPGAVVAFLSTYGPTLGPNIGGTLGFDTVANPSTPNIFSDPINLSNFYSEGFLGLGSATAAILTGPINPSSAGYQFGGGGGTLTVQSNLPDFDGTELIMSAAPSPVTVLLQGSNTYQGGTRSLGGVLIFDSPTPTSGEISLYGGYVGYTELASNIANAQQFVSLVNTFAGNGVIGFDSTNPASPRTISDPIDLSGFDSDNVPFIGTATVVTLSGPITPANNQYQFTGVKGGQLTVTSNLTDGPGSSLTIGLENPIESNGSVSTVTLTGDNTFSLGTTFNSGVLFINNDNALGTGPISVPDSATTTIIPYLAPFGGNVTLANPIAVGSINGGPGITLGNGATSDMLTLSGTISDFPEQSGQLAIDGSVTLSGTNTYSGGTTLDGNGSAILLVTNSSSVGTGPIMVQSGAVIAPFNVDVVLANDITLNSSLTLGEAGNENLLTLNGVISGSWNVVIQSNVTLNGANTYSDGTLIEDANVIAGNASALGTGSVQLADAMLTFTAAVPNPTILDLTGDSESTIVLPPSATLTLDTDSVVPQPSYYNGAIQGDASTQLVKIDTGTEYLGGTSTYGGGTTVSAGGLIAGTSGSLGTGTVAVAAGAMLGVDSGATLTNTLNLSAGAVLTGRGTFSPPGGVTFAGGTTVSPGNAISGQYVSTLSFGTPVTFGTGGIYGFNVATASGTAGVDYSTLSVTGALTLSATVGSPFTIMLSSIDPGTGSPGLANFNSTQPYAWTLVTATSIAGVFNSSDFTVNTTSFQNALGGGMFLVGESGNTLILDFTPVPEPSTWMLLAAGLATAVAGLRLRRRRQIRSG